MKKEHCIVVGAGHAGGRAVEALRKYEYPGAITLVGAEDVLPLERPPLSKAFLENPIADAAPFIHDEAWYRAHDIELKLGVRANNLDVPTRVVGLSDGSELPWTSMLITTGTRIRKLSVPGGDLAGVHYLRTLSDAQALSNAFAKAKRVVIVGGGFIGLEAASIASKRGQVVVLEAADNLMGRAVLPEIAGEVKARFDAAGIEIVTGAMVTGFKGEDGHLKSVVVDGGSMIEADCAVVGIGVVPEIDFVEAAGIDTDNGILVDEYCQTSAADVYAAGDVTNHFHPVYGRRMRLESWANAQNQAITAARNVVGERVAYTDIPWFWSDQLDFKIQVAGAPNDWDAISIRRIEDNDVLAFQIKNGQVVGLQGIGALKDLRRARKLLEVDHVVDVDSLSAESVTMKDLVAKAIKAA